MAGANSNPYTEARQATPSTFEVFQDESRFSTSTKGQEATPDSPQTRHDVAGSVEGLGLVLNACAQGSTANPAEDADACTECDAGMTGSPMESPVAGSSRGKVLPAKTEQC